MKTTLTKEGLADLITYTFIALFAGTAASKIMTYERFDEVLGKSPLIGSYHAMIAWLVPASEIIIGIILLIPAAKKAGLYASLVLLVLFTIYLIYMVSSGSTLPCQCGGVISLMTWQEHIWFNIGCIILAIAGLILYKK